MGAVELARGREPASSLSAIEAFKLVPHEFCVSRATLRPRGRVCGYRHNQRYPVCGSEIVSTALEATEGASHTRGTELSSERVSDALAFQRITAAC